MKEKLHTIPVNDAFDAGDECPFCFLERQAEQRALRYVAGPSASYMEPDVREATNRVGFCRAHMKKLYDYGNVLGTALMLQTYYIDMLEEFHRDAAGMEIPEKRGLFRKKQPPREDAWWRRLNARVDSCYICDKIDYNMGRYYATFFALVKEPEFRAKVEGSKGFCLGHFAKLLELAEELCPAAQREWFYATAARLTEENLIRVKGDLDWLIDKYDYRNAGADWRNSRDALQRAMQKLEGGYPADKTYKAD